MIVWEVETTSPEQTQDLGRRLGEAAEEGDVICLIGDLGAGKTTLTQGLAKGLGVTRRVTSPTFTVVQEYSGRLKLFHVDCYRLEGPDDLGPLDAEDWLGRVGVTVIEWPERVVAALPSDRLELSIDWVGETRRIRAVPQGPGATRLAAAARPTAAHCATTDGTDGEEKPA